MIALLKIGGEPLTKIRDYSVGITRVEGSGGGTTENGDEILDYRCLEKAVITVTFANLTTDEFAKLKSRLKTQALELTYWAGEYKTITAKIGDMECELLKSEHRPNTEKSNYWNVSTMFTQIRG
ncbi:MAG: hypothetical protein NC299_13455 [Lachnospiraceae bacterium]|nr:hypothetical protein [Ruminococcus sp.]MCM1276343.1 hypothetical protein [Lachnospiraceae bacterium]